MHDTETDARMERKGWVLCADAARRTKHSVQAIYRWIETGKVRGMRAGYRRYAKWRDVRKHLGPEFCALHRI